MGGDGKHVVLTSCSRRLMDLLSLNNPYVRIIKSGILGHLNHYQDGGLLVATLATKSAKLFFIFVIVIHRSHCSITSGWF